MLREGEELPEIYKDEAFGKSNHWELSTSQLSSPYFDGWGYGEGQCFFLVLVLVDWLNDSGFTVVPDGYGLAYSIGNDYIRWTITSLRRQTADLRHYLAEAAAETRAMMERAEKAEEKHAEAKL
jgi:carnitine O-acetyltransferase